MNDFLRNKKLELTDLIFLFIWKWKWKQGKKSNQEFLVSMLNVQMNGGDFCE